VLFSATFSNNCINAPSSTFYTVILVKNKSAYQILNAHS